MTRNGVKVKICGITNLEDARFASLCGVDFLGFIFAKSPRRITPARAQKIIEALPKGVEKVGVFVNSPAAYINRVAKKVGLDIVQLHGDESPEFCKKIKLPVVKVFRVKNRLEPLRRTAERALMKGFLDKLKDYKVYAFLVDAYVPGKRGGTGKKTSWSFARGARDCNGRIFLSGGLSPANLKKAIKTVRPFAVDLNSGVETAAGKKDFLKIKRAIEIVKCL